MKSPLNLLDGLTSQVRARGDEARGSTVDPSAAQGAGSAAKDVPPALAKKFDALLAEAVENESASASGKGVAGSITKAVAGSIVKGQLSTTTHARGEQGVDAMQRVDVTQVASTDAQQTPSSKIGPVAQPGPVVSVQGRTTVPGDVDVLVEEVPLKTTPKAPAKDLSREAQNVLPSGPGSFHSTISQAAKQVAREVKTGTMAASPEADAGLAMPLDVSTPAQKQLVELDQDERAPDAELTVEDTTPIEERQAPSAPLAALLENVAALVSRIVAPPPHTSAGAPMADAEVQTSSLRVDASHGGLAEAPDTLQTSAPEARTPVDAQAFRELTVQATPTRVANTDQADAPRVDTRVSAATTQHTQVASVGSELAPAAGAVPSQARPAARLDATQAPAAGDAARAGAGYQAAPGSNESALRAAPSMPQQGGVTLSAAERAAVSSASAAMVQSAGTSQQALTGNVARAPASSTAASATVVSPTVQATAPGVANTNASLSTTGATSTKVVVTTSGQTGDARTPNAAGIARRVPAAIAAPAPALGGAAPIGPSAVPATPPTAQVAEPAAAAQGLRAETANVPAPTAAPTNSAPVITTMPAPALEPVLVQQGALAQQGVVASAANTENTTEKGSRAGEPSSDGPIAPLRGFSRGAFVGQAMSAYGGRGHESTDQQSTRGRFSEESEPRTEASRAAEPNVAADLSALAQQHQPTPEAAPAPPSIPQPAAPMAPPQPIVDVPTVEFAARPPASQNENASVSIHHPDLGPIRLDVQRTAGRIEVHAVIESVHAEAVLRANESGIRQSVQQSGMTFSALRVRVRGEETNPARQAQVRRRRANERET